MCLPSYKWLIQRDTMRLRLRIILIIIGILLITFSLLALVYAFATVETQQLQATLAPTLLSPP
jgi:uncharacterized membrane protein (Fun14 family)